MESNYSQRIYEIWVKAVENSGRQILVCKALLVKETHDTIFSKKRRPDGVQP
jgi:hypothetical protein